MIYLRHTTESQGFYIPKNGRKPVGKLTFKAKSVVGLSEISSEVIDLNISAYYYNVAIALGADVQRGEYEYSLTDEDGELSTGLLVVGEDRNAKEYNQEIIYKQYE